MPRDKKVPVHNGEARQERLKEFGLVKGEPIKTIRKKRKHNRVAQEARRHQHPKGDPKLLPRAGSKLLLPRAAVRRVVVDILHELIPTGRIQKEAVDSLHTASEALMHAVFSKAHAYTAHRGRVQLEERDFIAGKNDILASITPSMSRPLLA